MFDFFKELYPKFTYKKKRLNENILIVTNNNLELLYLNETSSFFAELCNGTLTLYEIYLKMLDCYDVDKEILKKDLIRIIRDLQWKNLLVFHRNPID